MYVTHDQVEAMTLADKLVVMNKGVAEQIDTPIKIYERPATTFVASFIGSPAMNLLRGSSAGPKGIALAGGQAVKPRDFQVPETGRDVFLGVRPEHLTLVNGGNSDLEPEGDRGGKPWRRHHGARRPRRIKRPRREDHRAVAGRCQHHGRRRAAARDQPGMAHVFDVQTEKRI